MVTITKLGEGGREGGRGGEGRGGEGGREGGRGEMTVIPKPIYISLVSWNSPNANWLERAVIGRY